MKSWVKYVFDRLLTGMGVLIYHAGLAGRVIHLNRRAAKVLMYHACEDVESEFTRGLSINTTPSEFAEHLDFLNRHYRVTSLAGLLEKPTTEPTVVITFDDGFRSVYENAFPRLRDLGLPAVCYLTTDVIGNRSAHLDQRAELVLSPPCGGRSPHHLRVPGRRADLPARGRHAQARGRIQSDLDRPVARSTAFRGLGRSRSARATVSAAS